MKGTWLTEPLACIQTDLLVKAIRAVIQGLRAILILCAPHSVCPLSCVLTSAAPQATADVTEDQHWAALLIYTSFCDQVAVVEHSLTEAVQKLAEAVALVDQLRNKEGGMVRQSDPGGK